MLVPLHGIASRHDLPLPFGFVLVGAALALALSFVVLLLAWRQPRFTELRGPALPGLTRRRRPSGHRLVARLLVLAAYAWAGLALMAGQDLLTNPVFGFVFVWVWVGLVPISLLLGGFWRATNLLHHPRRTEPAGRHTWSRACCMPERIVWAGGVGPVRLRLAGAGPAGPHHAGRLAGLGAGLAGARGDRRDRLRPPLDRRRRPVRDLRRHRRAGLALGPADGRCSSSTRWPT